MPERDKASRWVTMPSLCFCAFHLLLVFCLMTHCFFNFFAANDVKASLLRDVVRRVAHLGPVKGGEMSEGSFWYYSSSSHFSKWGLGTAWVLYCSALCA